MYMKRVLYEILLYSGISEILGSSFVDLKGEPINTTELTMK